MARFRDLRRLERRVNLTAITDPLAVEQMLFLDALRMAPAISEAIEHRRARSLEMIDIGTGAGFPDFRRSRAGHAFTLLDATSKKIAFIGEVVRDLGLANVAPLHGRAEEIRQDGRYRERFDLATARAVSSLPALIELAMPLLTQGGQAFFPKSSEIEDELNQGQRAANVLGGRIASAQIVPAGTDEKVTRLVIVDKIGATPNDSHCAGPVFPPGSRWEGIQAYEDSYVLPEGKAPGRLLGISDRRRMADAARPLRRSPRFAPPSRSTVPVSSRCAPNRVCSRWSAPGRTVVLPGPLVLAAPSRPATTRPSATTSISPSRWPSCAPTTTGDLDLELDLWIDPDGTATELDRDEFDMEIEAEPPASRLGRPRRNRLLPRSRMPW